METDVAVVGGGISGLAAAHFLTRRGLRVVVLERDARAGGVIGTIRRNGFLAECGPNSVLDTSAALRRLIDEVGLSADVVYPGDAAKNRYIVHGGQLQALPTNPVSFLTTRLFTARAKIRLLAEPFIRPHSRGGVWAASSSTTPSIPSWPACRPVPRAGCSRSRQECRRSWTPSPWHWVTRSCQAAGCSRSAATKVGASS